MLNYIWITLMIISFVCASVTGNMENMSTALLNSGFSAVEFVISIVGMMAMWSGFMAIAEKSGITAKISKRLSPFMKWLFPTAKNDKKCLNAICMNIVANFLGLSNAATPLGIKAMELLNEKNPDKTRASHDMCMFAVINSGAIQLIPSTLIAMRITAGCLNPTEIILPIWIVSLITFSSGILAVKFMQRRYKI